MHVENPNSKEVYKIFIMTSFMEKCSVYISKYTFQGCSDIGSVRVLFISSRFSFSSFRDAYQNLPLSLVWSKIPRHFS